VPVEELEENQQQDVVWYSGHSIRVAAWTAIVIPAISFYLLLSKTLSRLPYLDDYNGPLAFLLQWKQQRGIEHLVQIITWQHNEYRLMLMNALVGAQYATIGHIDLRALAILGNTFILLMFGVLYLISRTDGYPPAIRLLVFVPISWILFQLH
jgi:hypothetical protein